MPFNVDDGTVIEILKESIRLKRENEKLTTQNAQLRRILVTKEREENRDKFRGGGNRNDVPVSNRGMVL